MKLSVFESKPRRGAASEMKTMREGQFQLHRSQRRNGALTFDILRLQYANVTFESRMILANVGMRGGGVVGRRRKAGSRRCDHLLSLTTCIDSHSRADSLERGYNSGLEIYVASLPDKFLLGRNTTDRVEKE